MTSDHIRRLNPEFKEALLKGILLPLLELVRTDRDLLLEIRDNYIDIYFKGNRLIEISQLPEYGVKTHEKFAIGASLGPIRTVEDAKKLVEQLPNIKQRIATHKSHASEIEIEHLLIRLNNREPNVNSEYFAIDRQGVYGPKNDRIDVLGVCWPRAKRQTSRKLDLCVMEVKLNMGGEIGKVADQLKKYYCVLADDLPTIAKNAQALLRDKIDLGLVGTDEQQKKLKKLEISDRMEDVRCVVVLAEQNPFSESLKPQSLSSLPFSRIEIFRVGFGLWSCDAYRFKNGEWRRPAVFGETI